jgi:hypothetical protein
VLILKDHQKWLLGHAQWTGRIWRCNRTQSELHFEIHVLFISTDKSRAFGHVVFLSCPGCRALNPRVPENLDTEDLIQTYSN